MGGMMGGMMGGAGDVAGGASGVPQKQKGGSMTGGGDETSANIMGMELPSVAKIGISGRDKGNAGMLQAAMGGKQTQPTANTGGSNAVDSLTKALMDSSSKPSDTYQRENPYGKNLDNPEGIDMLHPTGQRQDLNLGNYGGKQKGVSDMEINWDKLKL